MKACYKCDEVVDAKAGTCPSCGENLVAFKNVSNGYIERVSNASWMGVLFFGPLFWLSKGILGHAIIMLLIDFLAVSWFKLNNLGPLIIIAWVCVNWIAYPVLAKEILRKHYLKKGWQPL